MSERGIIATTDPARCEYCGAVEELRPYGRGGENICFDCAMRDEETTQRRFAQHVLGERHDA